MSSILTLRSGAHRFAFLAAIALAFSITLLATGPSSAGSVLKSGSFYGQSDHITTGKVTIKKDGDRTLVVLEEDFSLDGAPAPTLGFTKDGKFDTATEFAKLKSISGRQVYELPRTFQWPRL